MDAPMPVVNWAVAEPANGMCLWRLSYLLFIQWLAAVDPVDLNCDVACRAPGMGEPTACQLPLARC
jgi:hypothetical protein